MNKTMNSLQKESTSRSLSSECLSRKHSSLHIFGATECRGKKRRMRNGWLIHCVFAQLVLILTVIIVLWVHIVRVSAVSLRANRASWLVDPVVDARVTYALAATVVEPPVARGAHALAGRLTFVPGSALRHERDRAVHRHYVRLQRMQLLVRGFCQPKKIS